VPLRLIEQMLGADDRSAHPALRGFLSPNRLFGGGTLRSYLVDLEVVLGLFVARFLAMDVVVGGCLLILSALFRHRPRLDGPSLVACAVAWIIFSKLELKSIDMLARALEMPEPRPVHLSLAQKQTAFSFRPLLLLWWLAHAATTIAAAELFRRGASHTGPPGVPQWFVWSINSMFTFGFAYASNTFLIMSAGALFPRERFVRAVWRMRFILDLLLATGIPPLLHLFTR
jgi:hypothetical protein